MADHDAPLGRAVDLGQHDAGALHGFGEVLGLADAVLAGRGVEHEQHFVRRVGNLLADHAANLRQLAHQVRLRLQAAGRVDDADVGLASRRPSATARWATLAGSLPGRPGDDLAPRAAAAQIVSCSTAAARNVSAAPSTHRSCLAT